LFQQPTLLPWQKVRDYVALPLRVRDRPLSLLNPFARLNASEEAEVKSALRRAKIPSLEEARPAQLSGGMQTRVALARTIVARPQVLLLDEPFNSLDEKLRSEIYHEIQAIVSEYRPTTFLVTHNLVEAVLLCDRVLVLAKTAPQAPASIVAEVAVDLPRPRDAGMFEERAFREALASLRGAIFAH
jgi:NitT/TauT family transport system ATP-binding protein